MKKYTIWEQKSYLVKVADDVPESMLATFGVIERDIWGFADSTLTEGKVVGKKIIKGLKNLYAIEVINGKV